MTLSYVRTQGRASKLEYKTVNEMFELLYDTKVSVLANGKQLGQKQILSQTPERSSIVITQGPAARISFTLIVTCESNLLVTMDRMIDNDGIHSISSWGSAFTLGCRWFLKRPQNINDCITDANQSAHHRRCTSIPDLMSAPLRMLL